MKRIVVSVLFLVSLLLFQKVSAQLTLVEWNFPNNPDDAIADAGIPLNATKTIYTVGGTGAVVYTVAGYTTQSASATGWDNGSGSKWWEIEFNTTGYYNLELSSRQRSHVKAPRDFVLEYKIGAAGTWTAVPAAPAITVADNFTVAVLTNIPLPAACENQPSVYLRWIMSSNTSVNNSIVDAGFATRIDDINVKANDSQNHYRSKTTGDWANINTWEKSPDLITWTNAQIVPNYYSKTITIRGPHTVSITKDVRIDETTINSGGNVNYNSKLLTINNGSGVDLQVNGSFTDGSATSAAWMPGATWALGANGTYTKTENTNAVNWQNNYDGGISTIPATANWVLHKAGSSATAPSLTTLNMYYPNLTIMSTSGAWTTVLPSFFTGNTGTAIIKGNLDIGGPIAPLLGTVNFLNDNTNALPVQVLGNVTIRGGCTLRNYGTGFDIKGDLVVNGVLQYGTANARMMSFSGSGAQSISGSAPLASQQIYNMEINKPSGILTLSKTVKVDNNLNLLNGIINSSAAYLMIIENGATATGANNTSFVNGPVQKNGADAFTFPVGKNSSYRPIGMGAAASGGTTFWSENFSSGAGWSLANVTGTEGTDPNFFTISDNEGGVTPPGCSTAGNGNNTLHVTSVFNPNGGAAYDAGGLCGILYCPETNRRAQSPVINCSGKSNISLSFNYIEYGDGTNDNATLWYYDGSTWTQIADMPKTSCCGGTCNGFRQGKWTAYSITLPASANNNANVQIGFKWQNNDDGVGTDPSFAVDDIALSVASSDVFTAEYFRANPRSIYGNITDPTLNHISQCEYWTLQHNSGTSSRNVTLSWDNTSCGVTLLPDLRIARWRSAGTIWNDLGNGSTTGNVSAGTITTAAPDNIFGPYTLSSTSTENPLPVELLDFDAQYDGKAVNLSWRTASEHNSDYFEVEKSENSFDFTSIIRTKAAGYSNSILFYRETDKNINPGVVFYRLKESDFDGKYQWSNTRKVYIGNNLHQQLIAAYSNGNVFFQLSDKTQNITAEIFNTEGALIMRKQLNNENGIFRIENFRAVNGLYFLRITGDGINASGKFSVRN
ncbi:MAG: T9SS type A sorting domain-containing protein [Bacteroidetes bacterium]|jgi:hypothetical protein|nr:T9SS type A sorting domain-containing protein [Bacteroidota bacterium]